MQRFKIAESPLSNGNTKRETFKRLAEKRTNAILDRIRILSNLANRSAYEFTEDDIRRIFRALDEELNIAKAKFRSTERRQFKLD